MVWRNMLVHRTVRDRRRWGQPRRGIGGNTTRRRSVRSPWRYAARGPDGVDSGEVRPQHSMYPHTPLLLQPYIDSHTTSHAASGTAPHLHHLRTAHVAAASVLLPSTWTAVVSEACLRLIGA